MSTEKPMPIGKLVQRSIPAILEYCETQDPAEFARLQDQQYSKETFNINYPDRVETRWSLTGRRGFGGFGGF